MQRQRNGIGVELVGLIEGDDEAGDVRALRAGEAEDLAGVTLTICSRVCVGRREWV